MLPSGAIVNSTCTQPSVPARCASLDRPAELRERVSTWRRSRRSVLKSRFSCAAGQLFLQRANGWHAGNQHVGAIDQRGRFVDGVGGQRGARSIQQNERQPLLFAAHFFSIRITLA